MREARQISSTNPLSSLLIFVKLWMHTNPGIGPLFLRFFLRADRGVNHEHRGDDARDRTPELHRRELEAIRGGGIYGRKKSGYR